MCTPLAAVAANQGKNYYLERHFLPTSGGGLSTAGRGPVYTLKQQVTQKTGIFEAGVDKAEDWGDRGFMTLWYNDKMVKRIQRDIREKGLASRFQLLCPAASNCDLQSARQSANWYKGDRLTGAYQIGKEFKIGEDVKINKDPKVVTHCFVATDQNGHAKPPHLCIAPHAYMVPDDLDVISYIKTNPMYDAIQTGAFWAYFGGICCLALGLSYQNRHLLLHFCRTFYRAENDQL